MSEQPYSEGVQCALCPADIDPHPFTDHLRRAEKRTAVEGERVIERVIDLWNKNDGWIPGIAAPLLAEALGVDVDRLVHYNRETHERHYPEGFGS